MKKYLEKYYSKSHHMWHWLRMVYINDYHKAKFFEAVEIVAEYDKKKASDLVINGNGGCFCNNFWDWIAILDPELRKLHISLETNEIMKTHFEIDF